MSAVPVVDADPCDLAGLAEAAEILGVSKQRAQQLSQQPGFPEPVARLKATPVWRRAELVALAASRRTTPGPVPSLPVECGPPAVPVEGERARHDGRAVALGMCPGGPGGLRECEHGRIGPHREGSVPVEGQDEAVEAAIKRLNSIHWDGTDCGTTGSNGCGYCFGPSPATAHEVVREVLEAAEPFIAARVRAEAVAEHHAELRRYIDVGVRMEAERKVAEAERDEYHRNWQAAERRIAEAVADERQRIDAVTRLHRAGPWTLEGQRTCSTCTTDDGQPEFYPCPTTRALAAGSVPAATPTTCEHECNQPHEYTHPTTGNRIPCPGPAATPPADDEVDRLRSVWRGSPSTRTFIEDRYPGLAHAIERAVTEADRGRG